MAIAFVQGIPVVNITAPTGVPFTSPNVAKNFLALVTRSQFSGAGVVSDTNANTWQQAGPSVNIAGAILQIWYAMNCKAGANTVKWSTGGATYGGLAEYSGIALANALDQVAAGGTATSNAPNSGSIVTTTARQLLIGSLARNNQTITPGTGWTTREAAQFGVLSDKIVSAQGTYSFDCLLSASFQWGAGLASFKEATALPNAMMLMGAGS